MANTTTQTNGKGNGKTTHSLAREVYAIKYEALREKLMMPALGKRGIPTDDLTKDQMAVALASSFEEEVKARGGDLEEELSACPECNARASEDLDVCPFCGEVFEAASESVEVSEDEDEEEEAEDEPEAKPVKTAAAKKTSAKAAAKKTAAKKTSAKAEASIEALKATEDDTTADEDASNVVGTVDDRGRVLVHVKGGKGKITTRELDKAVDDVKKIRANTVVGLFTLGLKLKEIVDKQLWKMRTKEDNTARWATFEAFCVHELNIAKGEAYTHIRMVETFTDQKQIEHLSISKIGLMLKVPDSVRDKLLKEAETTPVRKLRDRVREETDKLPEEERTQNRSQQAKAASKGGKKKAAAAAAKKKAAADAAAPKVEKRDDKITVASILKKTTVKLVARPQSLRGIDINNLEKDCKRAKKIADRPFGRLVLANDVSLYLDVRMGANGLEIVAEARRDG